MSTEFITFGCRLNTYESEVMRENAAAAGLTDAVIVNTCAVTSEAERQARQAIRKARRSREIASLEEAQQVRSTLESSPVKLQARAGSNGRLFGAVTPGDVADAVAAVGGPKVDRRKVELGRPIKSLGDYTVHVRLHPEVQATVKLQVVSG